MSNKSSYGWDLDDTLWVLRRPIKHGVIEIESIRNGALALAKNHYNNKELIVFISGRPESLRNEIFNYLGSLGISGPPICLMPNDVEPNDENILQHKIQCLREFNVTSYVGDRPTDKEACEIVGIEYVDSKLL